VIDAGRTRSDRDGSTARGGVHFHGPVTFGADMDGAVRELDWYTRVLNAAV
jgi:ribulose-5-phosphate 4-epimerase/fuculose-1-phosphate aldolase